MSPKKYIQRLRGVWMDKVLGMLGMAKKAGKVKSGGFLCDKSIKAGESRLIIIAEDASENSKKAIKNSCGYYNVEYIEYSDMETLGKFTGSGKRAVISVNDSSFAAAIKKKFCTEVERNGVNGSF